MFPSSARRKVVTSQTYRGAIYCLDPDFKSTWDVSLVIDGRNTANPLIDYSADQTKNDVTCPITQLRLMESISRRANIFTRESEQRGDIYIFSNTILLITFHAGDTQREKRNSSRYCASNSTENTVGLYFERFSNKLFIKYLVTCLLLDSKRLILRNVVKWKKNIHS